MIGFGCTALQRWRYEVTTPLLPNIDIKNPALFKNRGFVHRFMASPLEKGSDGLLTF